MCDTDGEPSLTHSAALCFYIFARLCVCVHAFELAISSFKLIKRSPSCWSRVNTHTDTHTHAFTQTHPTISFVFAGRAPDLGQRRALSGPFHPPEPPAASVLHPRPSSPLTPPCQGLFPKIRLNMNIHKQNGTPRL